jgi:hypothetical protein
MKDRVIAYMPKEEEDRPASDMGTLRRGLWVYTNKLGLNFSLVLLLSLAYQIFVALFIAFRGMKTLPILQELDKGSTFEQVLSTTAAIFLGLIIQGLIIAELAQVVWLRHPDRLKVRLMRDSIWWWFMLVALIITLVIDFFLLFLSVTGKKSLSDAWQTVTADQLTGFTTILLAVLSMLTLLRCASVMKTSTSEEIRREVEERLKAIAEEILIDAGDSARAKATKVWKKLSVNPERFIPIHESVLRLVSQQHPDLVPPQIGGNSWAYDFNGNTFAAIPPDMHTALLQSKHRAAIAGRKPGKLVKKDYDENEVLWKAQPSGMVDLINHNLDAFGRPKFVDITEPDNPKFISPPISIEKLDYNVTELPKVNPVLDTQATTKLPVIQDDKTRQLSGGIGKEPDQILTNEKAFLTQINQLVSVSAPKGATTDDFITSLNKAEKLKFGKYLAKVVYPYVHGDDFPLDAKLMDVYDYFDDLELQWYYRYWKKHADQGINLGGN